MLRTWLFAGSALAVRIAFLVFSRIDSDEPQHLHVAWAWSRGLVQYRDVFDNHFPLLHLLFAPLLAVAPESSAIFTIARVAMQPFAIGCALLVFALARKVMDEGAAMVAAIAFSVLPPWLPKSVEFRNDTLWIFFWLLMLVALTRWGAGVLAGAAAALCVLASVKAIPLLLAHALALLVMQRRADVSSAPRFIAGAAIPLACAALFFLAHGALDDMLYATLSYNAALPVHAGRRLGGALAFTVIAPALALRWPRAIERAHPLTLHLALFAIWYTVLLLCFWPLLTPRDFLPLVPLGALLLTRVPPIAILAGGALISLWYAQPWDATNRRAVVDAAVRLAKPHEPVFDLKGETVFRRRAVFTLYEVVGRTLTHNGTIADRGPEEIAAARSCVAIADASYIPPRTRAFLNQHFVSAGAMRVCGTTPRGGAFTIAVPQTYAVIARDPSRVRVDGKPYRGPLFLGAGAHTIDASEPVAIRFHAD